MRTGVNRGDRKIQWCVGFSRIPLGVKEIAPGGRGHGGPFPYPNPHLLSNWLGQIVTRYNALLTHPPYDTATKAKQNEAVLFFVMRRPDRDLDPLRRAEILISAQNRESSEKRTNNDNTGLAWAIWLTPCLSTNEKLCNMPKDSRGTCNS
jgi:hypothetical protein